MKNINIFFLCFIISSTLKGQILKQDVIASGGDYFKSSSNSLSWTLGECVTETFNSHTNAITQGFQQSTYVITAIDEKDKIEVLINVYPNPVNDHLTVSFGKVAAKGYKIELLDTQGKLLHNRLCFNHSADLEVSGFPSGIYLLKISSENQNLQTFKIQKIN